MTLAVDCGGTEEYVKAEGLQNDGSRERKQNAECEDSEVLERVSEWCLPRLEQSLNVTRGCKLRDKEQQERSYGKAGQPNGLPGSDAAVGGGNTAHKAQIEERRWQANRHNEIQQAPALISFRGVTGLFLVKMHQRIIFLS